jgi:uncharacterized membrane protein
MNRIHLGPNTELLLAERALVLPAVLLGLAAGLDLFFWLRSRRPDASLVSRATMLVGSLAAGLISVGGAIPVAGAIEPAFGWACAGTALVAVLVVAYTLGTRNTASGGAVLLLVLRLLAIGVLLLLYFEPTLKLVSRGSKNSKLLVVVDRSGSMKINDGPNKLSRLDWVKSELIGRRGALEALDDDFEIELYPFDERLERIDEDALEDLKPEGRSTTIGPTLGEVCKGADKLTTIGALVLTDGIDNSGRDPVDAVAQAGLPVFAVAVGSKLREKGDFKDIAVGRVDYERYIAAQNKSEIAVHVDAVGLNGRRVAVVLRFDGKEVDKETLVLDDFPGTQRVKLEVTPEKKGSFTCSVEVTEDPEERLLDNNKKEFDVVVTDPAIKVLLVEGVPGPGYKWLLRTLQMDPNVSLLSLARISRDRFLQQGNTKEIKLSGFPKEYATLKKFNVVVLSDIHRSLFTTEQLRNIQRRVESGGGFLMLGGNSSLGPGGYADTPVETVLPVRLIGPEAKQEVGLFEMRLTDDGAMHPVFSGITPFFGLGDRPAQRPLPQLKGCTHVGELKPGAVTLAVHPGRTGQDGKPLIVAAAQRYGRGHTMVFTADGSWRWYFALKGMGRDTPYVRFWGQAMRWLAGHEVKEMDDKPGLPAYTDRRYYEPGSTVRIYARVRDQNGQATNQATVTAAISGPGGDASTRQVPYVPGSTGKYEVDYEPPRPGSYTMLVKAETLNGPIGTAELEFRVGRPNLEFDRLDLDEAMLKRLAEKTKGRYVPLVGLNIFIERLRSQEQAKSTITSVNVWDDDSVSVLGQDVSPYLALAFLLFTALVTAEWVIRKRRQLV